MSGGYKGKHAARSRKRAVVFAAGAAVVLAIVAGAVCLRSRPAQGPDAGSQRGSLSQQADGSVSSEEVNASGSAALPLGPDSSRTDPVGNTAPEVPGYDFSQPAPEVAAVDSDYFADAAFVGDSRTDGFMLYSGIGTGKNLTSNGLSIFKLAEKKALTIGGEQYTLLEALALEEYGKVYLSLGVNELGTYNDDGFYRSYSSAIDEIRRIQPNAVIYIQGLIPLNEGQIKEANGNKFNLTNDHLRVYNDLMRQVAEEKQVVYLDLYSEFVDENGELPRGVSRDGVHLVKDACKRWLEYLKTHTVDFDTLYPDGPPAAEPIEPAQPDTSTSDGSGQG